MKIRSHGDGATDFHARKIHEADSSVILIDSVPKRMKTIMRKCFQKIQIHWQRKKKQYLDICTDGLKFSFDYSNESDEK